MKQAGLDFQEVRIALRTPTASREIEQYSPAGKVPVLLDNGLTIWDSLAICEYLAESFPDRHWWPEDKAARAVARSVSAEMHSGFLSLRQNLPMDCRARVSGKEITPAVRVEIDRITSIWQDCRGRFGIGGQMLFGEFTIADAMFAPVVSRFTTYGIPLDSVCQTYAEAIWALPAMQSWAAAAEAEKEVIQR